jgi:hypothetical protein
MYLAFSIVAFSRANCERIPQTLQLTLLLPGFPRVGQEINNLISGSLREIRIVSVHGPIGDDIYLLWLDTFHDQQFFFFLLESNQ